MRGLPLAPDFVEDGGGAVGDIDRVLLAIGGKSDNVVAFSQDRGGDSERFVAEDQSQRKFGLPAMEGSGFDCGFDRDQTVAAVLHFLGGGAAGFEAAGRDQAVAAAGGLGQFGMGWQGGIAAADYLPHAQGFGQTEDVAHIESAAQVVEDDDDRHGLALARLVAIGLFNHGWGMGYDFDL